MTSHRPHSPAPAHLSPVTDDDQDKRVADLTADLVSAQEREKKALADYQNLLRRTQSERQAFVQLANQDLILSLLEPLQHLIMTAQQLQSPILDTVVKSLRQVLTNQGLEEIECLGQPFDPATMEAVDVTGANLGHKQLVKTIVRPGYKLNGQVIQVARVGL